MFDSSLYTREPFFLQGKTGNIKNRLKGAFYQKTLPFRNPGFPFLFILIPGPRKGFCGVSHHTPRPGGRSPLYGFAFPTSRTSQQSLKAVCFCKHAPCAPLLLLPLKSCDFRGPRNDRWTYLASPLRGLPSSRGSLPQCAVKASANY